MLGPVEWYLQVILFLMKTFKKFHRDLCASFSLTCFECKTDFREIEWN